VQIIAVCLLVAVQAGLWHTVYATGHGRGSGLTLHQILVYAVIARIWWQVSPSYGTANLIATRVRDGSIGPDLVMPVSLVGGLLSKDLGRAVANALLIGVPTLVLSLSIIGAPPRPASIARTTLALVIAYFVAFYLSAAVGLLAFVATRIDGFNELRGAFVTLLGGALVPLGFYPHVLRDIALASPFVHIYYVPFGLAVGDKTIPGWTSYAGIAWTVALAAIVFRLANHLRTNFVVQGG